jgi:hypothetical protein
MRAMFPVLLLPFYRRYLPKESYWLVFATLIYLLINYGVHWQTSNGIAGANTALSLLYYISLVGIFSSLVQGDVYRLIGTGRYLVYLAVPVPVTILIFRMIPSIEYQYLSSFIAEIFIDYSELDKFVSDSANVHEVTKAGGYLFTNGNWAATFCFVIFCCIHIFFQERKAKFRWAMSLLFLTGMFFTGSKTPYFLVPISLGFLLFMKILMNSNKITALLLQLFIMIFLLAILLIGLESLVSNVTGINTFQIRVALWSLSLENINEYWLLGGGNLYWANLFVSNGGVMYFREVIPPHNSILALLMSVGIVPVVCVVIYVCRGIIGLVNLVRNKSIASEKVYGLWAGLALLWVFLHSLLSNLSPLGDFTIMVPLALVMAGAHSLINKNKTVSRNLSTKEL